MSELQKKIAQSIAYIKNATSIQPQIGIILGSGLGELADEIDNKAIFRFQEIPHFPHPTIEGHKGNIVLGTLEEKKVMAMQGRIHYYEGYSMQQITFPVRLMKAMGINSLILTNACGGLNPSFNPGDLMLILDHINLMGDNPLIGQNEAQLGPRFPDMAEVYSERLIELARNVARKEGITLKEGIYTAVTGPSYETRAEIRFIKTIGSDAVGMSTVPEAIVAVHSGIELLGISCITDVVTGEKGQHVTHEEVLKTVNKAKNNFKRLLRAILREM